MKIVITMNELKASHELFARIGFAGDAMVKVLADMKEGETKTQEEIVRSLDVSDEAIAKLNKNKNVLSVVKHLDGNGTTCFTMIISEDFICDTNKLYGDCIVEAFTQITSVIKSLSIFFKGKVKEYLDKWKLQ